MGLSQLVSKVISTSSGQKSSSKYSYLSCNPIVSQSYDPLSLGEGTQAAMCSALSVQEDPGFPSWGGLGFLLGV